MYQRKKYINIHNICEITACDIKFYKQIGKIGVYFLHNYNFVYTIKYINKGVFHKKTPNNYYV